MDIEKLKPYYFDNTLLVEPSYRLEMVTMKGQRWYYHFEDDKPVFKEGVTSWIKSFMPTSPFLINWIADKGLEEAERYKNERGSYGTILHICTGRLTMNGFFDLDEFENEWIVQWCIDEGLDREFINKNVDELKKDILSWSQFLIDVDWQPLAIEIPLKCEALKFASHIDHVGYMNVKEKGFFGEVYKSGPRKDEPKESYETFRVLSIIDIKSNRKSFFEENEIQLHAYKRLWEENFPDHSVQKLFNWSPKEWRTTPTYNLKDQTTGLNKDKLDLFCQLAEIERAKKDKTIVRTGGKIDLKSHHINLSDNIEITTLEDIVIKNREL